MGVSNGAAWLNRIAPNAMVDRAQVFRLVKEPVDQRRVVEMRFVEEKSIREIADELDPSDRRGSTRSPE